MNAPCCPYCRKSDGTYPLTRVTDKIVTWLCQWCGLTFDVEE